MCGCGWLWVVVGVGWWLVGSGLVVGSGWWVVVVVGGRWSVVGGGWGWMVGVGWWVWYMHKYQVPALSISTVLLLRRKYMNNLNI